MFKKGDRVRVTSEFSKYNNRVGEVTSAAYEIAYGTLTVCIDHTNLWFLKREVSHIDKAEEIEEEIEEMPTLPSWYPRETPYQGEAK